MLDFKLTKKHIPSLLLFLVIILASMWNILMLLPLVLVVIFKIFKGTNQSFHLTYLDIGFILLLLGEIIATIFSSYVYNSLSSINRIVIIFSIYILYKNVFRKENNHFFSLLLFYFFSSILLILTIKSFLFFYNNLTSEGFIELNNFKNLYTPLGFLNNIWTSALLLFIPFNLIFLLQQDKKEDKILIIINLLFNVFCIIVSFSRGTYLSVFIFILLLNILLIKHLRFRQLFSYNIIALLMFTVSVLMISDSFKTTVSFNKTESQLRSTSGRIALWENSLKLINDKPIVGYGQDNYLIAQDKSPPIGEDIGSSYRTNNTYIQLLIERGVLGLVSFSLFIILVIIIVFKSLKSQKNNKGEKIKIVILFSGIIAILTREFTFSTLFENDFIYLLAFHLIFLLIPYDIKIKEFKVSNFKKNGFLAFSLILVSILLFINTKRVLLVYNNNIFVETYKGNEIQKSLKYIDKALTLSPKNITLNKNKAIALANNSFNIEVLEGDPNLLNISNLNKDSLSLSLKYLHQVLDYKPLDSETFHNLGWVNFVLGNDEKASFYFNKAIELNPYISEYHISFLFYSIKNKKEKDIAKHLSIALMLSPDILESKFYREFSKKYPLIAFEATQDAISKLKHKIINEPNTILKARLARLLLNENPIKSFQLFEEVTISLPNLDRPWMYMGFIASNTGDTIKAKKYFKNSLFFGKKDFLPKLYYGKYLITKEMDEETILLLKESVLSYNFNKSPSYGQNKALSNLETIPNSYLPNDLLYYLKPYVNASQFFEFFKIYYDKQNNLELKEYYNMLSLKYKNKIFKGEGELK